jgi:hypothetical protein
MLLSAAAALALLGGSGFVMSASAQSLDFNYETVNTSNGPRQALTSRVTLFELYGFWPLGFDPVANASRANKPATQELDLLDIPDSYGAPEIGYIRRATLYWIFDEGSWIPKVNLKTYDYVTPEYIENRIPSGIIPVGLTDPDGDLFVNPITLEPVGVTSPSATVPGFAAFGS